MKFNIIDCPDTYKSRHIAYIVRARGRFLQCSWRGLTRATVTLAALTAVIAACIIGCTVDHHEGGAGQAENGKDPLAVADSRVVHDLRWSDGRSDDSTLIRCSFIASNGDGVGPPLLHFDVSDFDLTDNTGAHWRLRGMEYGEPGKGGRFLGLQAETLSSTATAARMHFKVLLQGEEGPARRYKVFATFKRTSDGWYASISDVTIKSLAPIEWLDKLLWRRRYRGAHLSELEHTLADHGPEMGRYIWGGTGQQTVYFRLPHDLCVSVHADRHDVITTEPVISHVAEWPSIVDGVLSTEPTME